MWMSARQSSLSQSVESSERSSSCKVNTAATEEGAVTGMAAQQQVCISVDEAQVREGDLERRDMLARGA